MGEPEAKIPGDDGSVESPSESEIRRLVDYYEQQMRPFFLEKEKEVREIKGCIHDSFFAVKDILHQAEDRLKLGNHRDWDESLYTIQSVINLETAGRPLTGGDKTDTNEEGMVAQLVESLLPDATAAKDIKHSAFLRRLAFGRSYWSDDDVVEQMEIRLILVREILKSRGDPGDNETLKEIGEVLSTVLDDVAAMRQQNKTKMPPQVSALLTKLGYY